MDLQQAIKRYKKNWFLSDCNKLDMEAKNVLLDNDYTIKTNSYGDTFYCIELERKINY